MTQTPLGRLELARTSVDAVGERRRDERWLAEAWAGPDTWVLVVHEGRTLVRGEELSARRPDDLGRVGLADAERYLLGTDAAGAVWFAVRAEVAPPAADGEAWAGLREVGAILDDRDAGLFVPAVALANWHATHPCCARCGARTEVTEAGHVRRCPRCAAEHYPRTDPAIIVMVTDDVGRGLLGRSAQWPGRRFSTLAGFVEPGESAEHAVAREIHEECGLEVVDIAYLGSQPWPFPSSLMLGFTARALDPEALKVDGAEIAEARWFRHEDLPAAVRSGDVVLPSGISIARRLVERWYGGPLPDGSENWR